MQNLIDRLGQISRQLASLSNEKLVKARNFQRQLRIQSDLDSFAHKQSNQDRIMVSNKAKHRIIIGAE